MNIPITTTFGQLCAGFLAVCAGISCIGAAIGWIIKGLNRVKRPGQEQNDRLDHLESRVTALEGFSKSDKDRLEEIEESNRMTLRALLTLLSHGIDGNNTEDMVKAQKEITTYLIQK